MLTKIRMREEKGFTLIELLIVVAIIGILAAIAIPQFAQYRKRGYIAAMKADLKNAYTAAQSYLTDYPTVSSVAFAANKLPGGAFTATKGHTMLGTMSLTSGSFTVAHGALTGAGNTGVVTYQGSITNETGGELK